MDQHRWERLSPLLDELLEVSPHTRARRLDSLHDEDPTCAEALEGLLAGLDEVDAGFLQVPAPTPFSPAAADVVGAYRLERPLGHGGMGVVWLARRVDGRFEGCVAIKFVHLALKTPAGLERFAREGRILARLSHPNISRLIDAGLDAQRQPYLVLEYVDGRPIDQYCEAHALGVRARLALFTDVLAAVAHAHTRLVLHRDLKPGNILVDNAGAVKLLDFGIAKLLSPSGDASRGFDATQMGTQAFTPACAAPEQVLGQGVGTATDVYSLGVLLYGLLGGGHPTPAIEHPQSALDALRAIVERVPHRLSEAVLARAAGTGADRPRARSHARALRGDLDNIVAKALCKAPEDRYAHAGEFADDVRRFLHDEPVRARPQTGTYVAAKFVRRHRWGTLSAVVILLAFAVAAASFAWQAQRVQRQRQRAEALVEFMLGDLRKRLEPAGRLDALDGVGTEVLQYYDRDQDGPALPDADSLGRRARALHLIGEIRDKRGQFAPARAAFDEAARTTRALLDQAPGDAQRVFNHAQSMFWLGSIERRLGQLDDAAAAMGDYLVLAHRLVAIDAGRAEWQMEVAYASEAVGVLELQRDRPTQALDALAAARDVQSSLQATHPDQRIELARTLGWISEAQLARGDILAALLAQRSKLVVLDQVPQAQDDRNVQEQRAIVLSAIGGLERLLGHLEAARGARGEALARYEAIVALDPDNMVWRINLATVRAGMAEILADVGDIAGAQQALHRVDADLSRARIATGRDSSRALYVRTRALLVRARLATAASLDATAADASRHLDDWRRFVSAGHQPDNDQRQAALQLEDALATLQSRAGRSVVAEATWRDVVREQAAGGHINVPMQVALASAWMGLGRRDEAARLVALVQKTACRSPEFGALLSRMARAHPG